MKSSIRVVLLFGILTSSLIHAEIVPEPILRLTTGYDRQPTNKLPTLNLEGGPRLIFHRQHAAWAALRFESPSAACVETPRIEPTQLARADLSINGRTIKSPDLLIGGYIGLEALFPFSDSHQEYFHSLFNDRGFTTQESTLKVHMGGDLILLPLFSKMSWPLQITGNVHYTLSEPKRTLNESLVPYDITGATLRIAADRPKAEKIFLTFYYRYHNGEIENKLDIQHNGGIGFGGERRFNTHCAFSLEGFFDYHSGGNMRGAVRFDILGAQSPSDYSLQSYLKRDIPKHVAPIVFLEDLHKKGRATTSDDQDSDESSVGEWRHISDYKISEKNSRFRGGKPGYELATRELSSGPLAVSSQETQSKEAEYLLKMLLSQFFDEKYIPDDPTQLYQKAPAMIEKAIQSKQLQKRKEILSVLQDWSKYLNNANAEMGINSELGASQKLKSKLPKSLKIFPDVAPKTQKEELGTLLLKYYEKDINSIIDGVELYEWLEKNSYATEFMLDWLKGHPEIYNDASDLFRLHTVESQASDLGAATHSKELSKIKEYWDSNKRNLTFRDIYLLLQNFDKKDNNNNIDGRARTIRTTDGYESSEKKRRSGKSRRLEDAPKSRSKSKNNRERSATRPQSGTRSGSESKPRSRASSKARKNSITKDLTFDSSKDIKFAPEGTLLREPLPTGLIEQPAEKKKQEITLEMIKRGCAQCCYDDQLTQVKKRELARRIEQDLSNIVLSRKDEFSEKTLENLNKATKDNMTAMVECVATDPAFSFEERAELSSILNIFATSKLIEQFKTEKDGRYLRALKVAEKALEGERIDRGSDSFIKGTTTLECVLDQMFSNSSGSLAKDTKGYWAKLSKENDLKGKIQLIQKDERGSVIKEKTSASERKALKAIYSKLPDAQRERTLGRGKAIVSKMIQSDDSQVEESTQGSDSKESSDASSDNSESDTGKAPSTLESNKKQRQLILESVKAKSSESEEDQQVKRARAQKRTANLRARDVTPGHALPKSSDLSTAKRQAGDSYAADNASMSDAKTIQSKRKSREENHAAQSDSKNRRGNAPRRNSDFASSREFRHESGEGSSLTSKVGSKKIKVVPSWEEVEAINKLEMPSPLWHKGAKQALLEISQSLEDEGKIPRDLECQLIIDKINEQWSLLPADPAKIRTFRNSQNAWHLHTLEDYLDSIESELKTLYGEQCGQDKKNPSIKDMVEGLCQVIGRKERPEVLERAKSTLEKMPSSRKKASDAQSVRSATSHQTTKKSGSKGFFGLGGRSK